jgi:sterol desaturase/sphingolipid hydroxylase (fatty acid hydroxylase superfamily)
MPLLVRGAPVSLIEPFLPPNSQGLEPVLQYLHVLDHHLQSVLLTAALIAVFVFAELVWPTGYAASIRGRITNIAIGLIVSVFAFVCTAIVISSAHMVWRDGLIGLIIPGWRGHGFWGLSLSVLVYGATWDFFQYWFHRWQHESPRLWSSHRVHHSDASVNTTTALRRSILELILIFAFILVPTIVVAGVDEVAAPIAFAVFYGWGFFNHANIRLSLGPLTPIFSGPQWHRLHHGIDREFRDQNYAAYFPILDIIFGTYRAPQKGEYPATGVSDAFVTAHPFQDCFFPRSR